MKKMLIVTNEKQYSYTDGTIKKSVTKKQAEKIFGEWTKQGLKIHRKYGMGGQVCWTWVEE